jgi:hypothetical protein
MTSPPPDLWPGAIARDEATDIPAGSRAGAALLQGYINGSMLPGG